jgi:hypothetical protein
MLSSRSVAAVDLSNLDTVVSSPNDPARVLGLADHIAARQWGQISILSLAVTARDRNAALDVPRASLIGQLFDTSATQCVTTVAASRHQMCDLPE